MMDRIPRQQFLWSRCASNVWEKGEPRGRSLRCLRDIVIRGHSLLSVTGL